MRRPTYAKLIAPSLQYIKSARVVFDPLDKYAVSAKEFLRSAHSPSMKSTNPKAQITMDLRHDKQPSYIAVQYINNSYKFYLTHKRTLDNIYYDMGMYVGFLEMKDKLDENEIDEEEIDEVDEMAK